VKLPEPVVEIGSYEVAGQEGYANVRPFFPGKDYIGCDMRPGPGVDRVENVEKLTFGDDSVGTMLMLDTLEHVANCHDAMREAFRVIKPGGFICIVSVMDFAVHLHPSDYWRFTPQAFDLLLQPFNSHWVFLEGNPFCPHTVIGVGVKGGPGAAAPEGVDELIACLPAVATPLAAVDYDDQALLQAYPYHTTHDGYARHAEMERELAFVKSKLEQAEVSLRECSEDATELAAIRGSRGWRAVQHARKVRQTLFPPRTTRGRVYQAIWRAFR